MTTLTTRRQHDPNTPEEGCTRCDCGSKYWDGNRCHSCGDRFRPWLYNWTTTEGHTRKEGI